MAHLIGWTETSILIVMISIIRSVSAPIWSTLLLMLGLSFFMSLLSIKLQLAGYSESIIGYVHSAYYAGLLVGAARVERLIRRIGHIRAFSTFASISTITILLQGLALIPLTWVLLRFIAGFSLAGLYVTIESWLLEKSTVKTRGQILSIYMIVLYFSQSTSQLFLSYIDYASILPFLVAASLCAASVIPISITRLDSPTLQQPSIINIFHLFKSSPFGVIGCVFSGIILSNFYSFCPNFAISQNISVSLLMSITILGGIILQWPLGKLSDIFDRRKVLIGTSFMTTIPAFFLFYFAHSPLIIYFGSFILGGLSFTLYPLSMTQVCDRVESHNITAVTGVLLFAYGFGAFIGPLMSPFLLEKFGPSLVYPFIAFVSGLLGFIGLYSLFRHEDVPMELQQDFVSLPNLTPIAYDLDPRGHEK